jgi:hypothetical protein
MKIDVQRAMSQTLGENIADFMEELIRTGEKLDFSWAADIGIDGVAAILQKAMEDLENETADISI